MNKISIIIPCYNEEKTILSVINEIEDFKDCEKEIIIIDDGSSDNTKNLLKELNKGYVKVFYHDRNYGKGKAIQTGIKESSGDIIIIQDADLEYSPKDYPTLIKPFLYKRIRLFIFFCSNDLSNILIHQKI